MSTSVTRSRITIVIVSGLSLCALTLAAPCASAQDDEPTPPHAAPPRTRIDGIAAPVTGGLAAAALGAGIGIYAAPTSQHSPEVGVWRGGIVADEPFRDLLRADTQRGIDIAGHISDSLMLGTIAYTALVDSLLVPLVQGDLDLAWQASLAHSLAVGLTLTAGGIVKRVANRARPYERECASNPNAPGCGSHDIYESFYSLHTGLAATSAGFSCALHLERNLYGDVGHDIASCGGSLAAATLTGLLRVVADRHYLSDVIVGGLLGFAVGYLVPTIVIPSRTSRLEGLSDEPRSDFAWSIVPMAGGEAGGVVAGGTVFGTF